MLSILCYTLALTAQRQSLNWCFWVKKSAFIRSKRRSVGASSCARTWRPLAAARTNPLTSGGPPGAVLGSLPKAGHGRGARKTSTIFPSQHIWFLLRLLPLSSPLPAHPSIFFLHNRANGNSKLLSPRLCLFFPLVCTSVRARGAARAREGTGKATSCSIIIPTLLTAAVAWLRLRGKHSWHPQRGRSQGSSLE